MEIRVYSNGIREGYVGHAERSRYTGTERREQYRNNLARAIKEMKLDLKRLVVTFSEAPLSFDGMHIGLNSSGRQRSNGRDSFIEVFPENGELFSEDELGKYLHEYSGVEVIIHPTVKVFR